MKPESQLGTFFTEAIQSGETLRTLALNHALNELDGVLDILPNQEQAPVIAASLSYANFRISDEAQALFGSGAPKDIRTTKPFDIAVHPTDPAMVVASRLTRFTVAGSGRAPIDRLMSGKSEGTETVRARYYLFAMQADSAQNHMSTSGSAQPPDKAPETPHSFDAKRFGLPTQGDYRFGIVRRGSDMQAFTFEPNPRFGQVVQVFGGGNEAIASELNGIGPIDKKRFMIKPVDLTAQLVAEITHEIDLIKEAHKPTPHVSKLHQLRNLVMRKSIKTPEQSQETK